MKRLLVLPFVIATVSCAELPVTPGSDAQFMPPLNLVRENDAKAKFTVSSNYPIGNGRGFAVYIHGGSAEKCDGRVHQTQNLRTVTFYLPVGRPTSVSTISVFTPFPKTYNCRQTFTIIPGEAEYVVVSDYDYDPGKNTCTLAISRRTESGLVPAPEAQIRKPVRPGFSGEWCAPD